MRSPRRGPRRWQAGRRGAARVSYILDALKKSERQRPPGPVPDLFTIQGPQPPAPPRPRGIVVAAGLAAAACLVAGWAWLGSDRREGVGEFRPPAGVAHSSKPEPEKIVPAAPQSRPATAATGQSPLRASPRRRSAEPAARAGSAKSSATL